MILACLLAIYALLAVSIWGTFSFFKKIYTCCWCQLSQLHKLVYFDYQTTNYCVLVCRNTQKITFFSIFFNSRTPNGQWFKHVCLKWEIDLLHLRYGCFLTLTWSCHSNIPKLGIFGWMMACNPVYIQFVHLGYQFSWLDIVFSIIRYTI